MTNITTLKMQSYDVLGCISMQSICWKMFVNFLRWIDLIYGSYLIIIRQWRYLVLGRHDNMLAATNMVHALDWIALPGTPVKSWYLLGIS
jgi:hypothetical protein